MRTEHADFDPSEAMGRAAEAEESIVDARDSGFGIVDPSAPVDLDAIEAAARAANNGKRWVAVAKSVREEDANTLGGAPTAHEGGICNVLGFNGLTGTEWRDLKRTMDDRAKSRAAFIAACDPSTVLAIIADNRRLRESLCALLVSCVNTACGDDGDNDECYVCEQREFGSIPLKHDSNMPCGVAEDALAGLSGDGTEKAMDARRRRVRLHRLSTAL